MNQRRDNSVFEEVALAVDGNVAVVVVVVVTVVASAAAVDGGVAVGYVDANLASFLVAVVNYNVTHLCCQQ